MRYFHYYTPDKIAVGVESDGKYFCLNQFQSIDESLDILTYDLKLDNLPEIEGEIHYACPIINPGKFICVGLNYASHAEETKKEVALLPELFCRYKTSYVAHREKIILSPLSSKYDYEGELCVIIGKRAKNVKQEQALDYVAGYSIFNDVTVRDYQGKTRQWFLGKNFDKSGAFGPYFVPRKNQDIFKIKTYINDKLRQNDSTASMIFSISHLIEIISSVICLEKGDVISTGTPAGVGYARDPRVYLQKGDKCRIEIEGIGILENIVD